MLLLLILDALVFGAVSIPVTIQGVQPHISVHFLENSAATKRIFQSNMLQDHNVKCNNVVRGAFLL